MSYETEIFNVSGKPVGVMLPDNYSPRHRLLEDDDMILVKFESERCIYAPFSRIVYHKNRDVELDNRKRFKALPIPFPKTTFLNSGGQDLETIILDMGQSVDMPLGIPVTVSPPIGSFYAQFSVVIIDEPEAVRVPYYGNPGLFQVEYRPRFKYEKRPEKEMAKLEEMRKEAFLESAGFEKS